MEFQLLYNDKLKVTLSPEDMEALQIHYDSMDHGDEPTRKALVQILDQGRREAGFSPRRAKLYIEVFPREDGGCVLFFTALRQALPAGDRSRSGIAPVVFEFDSADTLTEGACKVFDRYSHRIYKSSLYRIEGRYRLVVYPLDYSDKLSVYFLSEFAHKVGEGELAAAHTEEYGRELIRDTAIDTLSEHFSPPAK